MTRLSVVVPVYRSEGVVGAMIERTLAVLTEVGEGSELILVNDQSPDNSIQILKEWSDRDSRVIVCDLVRNVGQHRALMTGMHYATGDWIATLDDDLQNPPEELLALLEECPSADLIFGRFRTKQHARSRVGGSNVVTRLNHWLYGLPRNLRVSNVRLFSREVFHRMQALDGGRLYLTGLAVLAAKQPVNVEIEHAPRTVGESTYTWWRLARLFASVMSAHPKFPCRGNAPEIADLVARVVRKS